MTPGRMNRLMAWLQHINNDLDDINDVFGVGAIDKDEIGRERYELITGDINEIQRTIDDILAEFENYGKMVDE